MDDWSKMHSFPAQVNNEDLGDDTQTNLLTLGDDSLDDRESDASSSHHNVADDHKQEGIKILIYDLQKDLANCWMDGEAVDWTMDWEGLPGYIQAQVPTHMMLKTTLLCL